MHVRFLLGPAGSGKTFRCLAEIRQELRQSPDGAPLLLLAPKQATFQLERQLLADPSLPGYTRLHILSFERLAQFVLDQCSIPRPQALSEEGRVMVLRALLIQHQQELKVFHASARLAGFAQQLSLLLRELQRYQLSPRRLTELAHRADAAAPLQAKLGDLALLLQAYGDWLGAHQLQDADHLLDAATAALRSSPSGIKRTEAFERVWLDGFAEMTPQELELLAALLPSCQCATLAFCLKPESATECSWLSTWSVVAQTFRRCQARLAALPGAELCVERLANDAGHGRFANNPFLRCLEANWTLTAPVTEGAPKNPNDNNSVRLVTCPDIETEAVFAAREILRHVRSGGRYRECAVIVRSLEPYHAALARVFRRYDLPVFMDRREGVSHHPLAELTRFALRTVTFGWRHDDWFGALKSGLVPATDEAIDELENESLARGWEGNVWRQPFPPAAETTQTARLEQLRARLLPPFENFAATLAENSFAPGGRQVADAIRELWRELKVEDTLERWVTVNPQSAPNPAHSAIHSTVLGQMHDWLDNLERALSAYSLPVRDWLPILEAGLAGLTVGVVPPALDQVLIGAVDRSRNPELKLVLVLGLNEGTFPAPPASGSLLTEADRDGLERQNIYLGPPARQRLGHERYFGYIACTRASERLVLTRAGQSAEGQPLNASPFFDHVQRLTGVGVERFAAPVEWWQSEHACEIEAPVLRAEVNSDLLNLPVLQALLAKWQQVQLSAHDQALRTQVVESLFGPELKSSVSALEEFAACPFKFFAARGLRLQERKEFQFDDRDKGSFHHEVLLEFHRRVAASGRRWRDLSPTEASQLAAEVGRQLLPKFGGGTFLANATARFTGEVLIGRLQQLVTALVAWMPQYSFDPAASEIAFDDDQGDLPAWRLDLGVGRALLLRGRIDRVDLCKQTEASALAVVMDYKSSARKLDATKLHHGLELQLLSYLGVLKELPAPETIFGVKRLEPAGVFYIPLNGGGPKPGALRADVLSTHEEEQRTTYQHRGRFLADELERFDNRGRLKGDQFQYAKKKNGDWSKRGNEALPAAEFEALREKVEGHLRDYGRRIFDGEVSVSPFRIGTNTACEFCDFRPVCRFDPWTQPFRTLAKPDRRSTR